MENCIFCKIINNELPSNKIYEDDNFLAFLDINPQSPGHANVIPKNHHRWVWDVPNIGEYFEVVQKIAIAQKKAFDTDWIIAKIFGDEVEHAHVQIYPNSYVKGDKKDFEGNAEKLRQYL